MTMLTAADNAFYDAMDVSLGPGVIEDLAAIVARGLNRVGDGVLPRLSHVTQEQVDSDWCSLTFHVYVTTSLLLQVESYGPPRGISAARIVEDVRSLWPRLDVIVAAAETTRCALERCLHELGADRSDMHLREVSLAPVGGWKDSERPNLELGIDLLGDDLRPKRRSMHFSAAEDASEALGQLVQDQLRRTELKRFLIDRAASGSMDQLTMSAINALPDPEQVLRQLGRHEQIWPTDDLYIEWREGRATSSGTSFMGLSWNGSRLEFKGVCLPATTLVGAVGRPVTSVSDHPLLSPAMIVARAWQAPFDDASQEVLVIEIEAADHLFSGPRATIDPRPLNFRTSRDLNGVRVADRCDRSTAED